MSIKYETKNGWTAATEADKSAAFPYCEGYKAFVGAAKTEREAAAKAVALAKERGFVELCEKTALKAGDKVYFDNRGKSVALAVIGQDTAQGANIVAAHIDSPRLDLKQNPLYEDTDLAFFKTHYYGGIKKYQWTTIPLALHGVVIKGDGTAVEITIGEDADDPVFCITDLLPHLADEQMKKTMKDAISGEGLNILIGSLPGSEDKDKVKSAVMGLLNEKYGIDEQDFISAELEAVPAGLPRDIGFDRALVGAYGHDDRVCAYPALTGIFETEAPLRTAICVLADKEEVGSMGNTGMQSRFFENFLARILYLEKEGYHDLMLRDALHRSFCLSADVGAGIDPSYKEATEPQNAARLGYGLLITKYTGSRGKAGSSDASAELVGKVRRLFNENGVLWQTGELGKVDTGGGGTVAQYIANLGVETLDCGVPLLSMHSPLEVAGKLDIYMAHKGYKAFYHAD
ncbi:M18 family aminopeptidase [Clostridia bacterium]|nr:M18 family aminopeptidase [Clostridia bacterium]